MADQRDISLAFEKLIWALPGSPNEAAAGSERAPLEVTVVFTHLEQTISALRKAADLAHNLNARIRLLVPQVVPFSCPLTCPPVLLEFNEKRFREIASQQSIETRVEICLCRDVDAVLAQRLKPHSLVVVGTRKRWWPVVENAVARKLKRRGHEVILAFAEPAKSS